jgi:hypothetical protein
VSTEDSHVSKTTAHAREQFFNKVSLNVRNVKILSFSMMYTINIFVIEYINFKILKTGVYIDNSKKTATCKDRKYCCT